VFSPQQFEILLSLTDRDRHGYGIIQDVGERTRGAVRLGTGALYTAIGRLAAAGLIRETDQKDAADARRRYYRLTAAGRRALEAEVARLDDLILEARQKGVRPRSIKGRS
jgi:DNA-binding PadR family transcriptional regulator